jgi:hypothetical protein
MTYRIDPSLENFGGTVLFAVLLFGWLALVPMRIAAHFGLSTDWQIIIWAFSPLALMFLVMGVVLAIRWIAPARPNWKLHRP